MALIKCPDCEGALSDGARLCPHCGWEKGTYLDAKGKVQTVLPNRISVADVDLPFWSVVKVAIKWVVASVPAVLLLVLILVLAIPIFSMIVEQLQLPQLLGK
jgi:hypothetical protein